MLCQRLLLALLKQAPSLFIHSLSFKNAASRHLTHLRVYMDYKVSHG